MSHLTLAAPQAPSTGGATPIPTLRISANAIVTDRHGPKVKWLDDTTATMRSRSDKNVQHIVHLNRENPFLSVCGCEARVEGHYLCYHIIRAMLSDLRRHEPSVYRTLLKKWRTA